MFNFFSKRIRLFYLLNRNTEGEDHLTQSGDTELSYDFEKNINQLKNIFEKSNDIIFREFAFGYKGWVRGVVIFTDGLTDKTSINENIIKPLLSNNDLVHPDKPTDEQIVDIVKTTLLTTNNVETASSLSELVEHCLSGDAVLLIDDSNTALVINIRDYFMRDINEPETESVVRGPREGFTEALRINIALLRRKIVNPDLVIESMKIGHKTRTSVAIAYLKSVANPKIVEEVKRRLNSIKIDAILESGYVEQFIEDAPYSIFPTVANSEKPDSVAAKMLEGRIAILVDGTPFVLTVPMIFIENFQTSEDYYSRPFYSSFIRILRIISYLITTLLPASYIALSTFHQEMLPTPLLFSMAASHEGIPFPSVLEMGIMMFVFEILREAGVRLPRPIGQSVSIVGALVIGEAAVSAGLIGAPVVIIIALTAVASFVVPSHTDSGVILRFFYIFLAGVLGGYGLFIGMLGVTIHLASLRSFGVLYFSPIAPLVVNDIKDTIVRVPLWAMLTRPKTFIWNDQKNQEFRLDPTPQIEKEGKEASLK